MKLRLAFWATTDDPIGAAREVRRLAREWAYAEPNITTASIGRPVQPYPDRAMWWEIPVTLTMAAPSVQESLWVA